MSIQTIPQHTSLDQVISGRPLNNIERAEMDRLISLLVRCAEVLTILEAPVKQVQFFSQLSFDGINLEYQDHPQEEQIQQWQATANAFIAVMLPDLRQYEHLRIFN